MTIARMTSNTPFYTLKDDQGKSQRNPVSPPPLTFDRVMEHRPPMSTSALFSFPVEILGCILECVESSSLAALALVNSDCRQLARSRQFADVCLDYSSSSEALVHLLVSESSERRMNNGSTSLPSLGACIRRLTVLINHDTMRQRVEVPKADFNGSEDHGLTLDEADQPTWQAIFTTINEVYLPLVQAVICSSKTLPHLETLDWEEDYNLSQDFYKSLASSSIQHLKLYHPIIEKVFEIDLRQPQAWQLRTLHLELTCNLWVKETATLCASILRLCASSLETLVWINRRHKDYQTFGDGPLPKFPRLRNLHIKMLELADRSIMDAFLGSKIVNLNIALETDLLKEILASCGQIVSLEALSMAQPPLSFLQANTQLSKLDIGHGEFSSESLEIQVLPILSTFSNLTSLRISWPKSCSVLPETGLCLIGHLNTLNQLCVSCGRQKDWRRSWAVDHRAIRQNLSPLRYLQRLALCGDTYSLRTNPLNLERYYIDTIATEEDLGYTGVPLDEIPTHARELMLDPKLGKPYWEKRHREKMILEGEEYINVFPSLEWIYIGERLMCVRVDNGWMRSRGVVTIDEMENKRSYLNSVFGLS